MAPLLTIPSLLQVALGFVLPIASSFVAFQIANFFGKVTYTSGSTRIATGSSVLLIPAAGLSAFVGFSSSMIAIKYDYNLVTAVLGSMAFGFVGTLRVFWSYASKKNDD